MFPKDHPLVVFDQLERERRKQYDEDSASVSDLDLTKKILGSAQCKLCSCGDFVG